MAGLSLTGSRRAITALFMRKSALALFQCLVRPGMRLNQIRFRTGHAVLNDARAAARHMHRPRWSIGDAGDRRRSGIFRRSEAVRDALGRLPCQAAHRCDRPRQDRPLRSGRVLGRGAQRQTGTIILDPGAFYILVSREAVHIPPDCAAEMAPYLAMVGEFRVHYAGFFDPGFGHGAAGGGQGSSAVCWRYAVTKPRLFWNTDRLSGVWSMRRWPHRQKRSMARASPRIIKVRA